ncbi:SNF2 family N-terminal domain-containing protein, partial [Ochromonadaceae sp. CCMP2298]
MLGEPSAFENRADMRELEKSEREGGGAGAGAGVETGSGAGVITVSVPKHGPRVVPSRATLIVVPPQLLSQWGAELLKHVDGKKAFSGPPGGQRWDQKEGSGGGGAGASGSSTDNNSNSNSSSVRDINSSGGTPGFTFLNIAHQTLLMNKLSVPDTDVRLMGWVGDIGVWRVGRGVEVEEKGRGKRGVKRAGKQRGVEVEVVEVEAEGESGNWGLPPHYLYSSEEVQFTLSYSHPRNRIYTGLLLGPDKKKRGFSMIGVRDMAAFLSDHDVVLTNYQFLQGGGPGGGQTNMGPIKNIHWHRIVLDECQEIKVATSQIAAKCAALRSPRRWMVSGTPLCTRLSDLHGELKFLRVWPFCLPNTQDGFWELRIEKPFYQRSEHCLPLLRALLRGVMMRHAKSQRYVLGDKPLIKLPARSIEWRGFDFQHADEEFALRYIEAFAADALERFAATQGSLDNWGSRPHFAHLRNLVGVMSRCISHPSCVNLLNLDHVRRLLVQGAGGGWGMGMGGGGAGGG